MRFPRLDRRTAPLLLIGVLLLAGCQVREKYRMKKLLYQDPPPPRTLGSHVDELKPDPGVQR